jgi:hypothetical protein
VPTVDDLCCAGGEKPGSDSSRRPLLKQGGKLASGEVSDSVRYQRQRGDDVGAVGAQMLLKLVKLRLPHHEDNRPVILLLKING